MFKIQQPANSSEFTSKLVEVATFEYLDEDFVMMIVEYPETEPFSEQFDESGYGSTIVLLNLPTDLLLYIIFMISTLLYYYSKVRKHQLQIWKKIHKKVKPIVDKVTVITYIYEAYFELTLISLTCYKSIKWEEGMEPNMIGNNWIARLFTLVMVTFPIASLVFYMSRVERLNQKFIERNGGPLLEGLRLEYKQKDLENKIIILHPFFFMLKRLVFAMACVYLAEHASL